MRPVQFINTWAPRVAIVLGRVMLVKDVHPEKAVSPMLFTVGLSVTDASFVNPAKVDAGIDDTPRSNVVMFLHAVNKLE